MEVTKGYKQTEVGVIPEDWEVKVLRQLCSSINDGTHRTPRYVDDGVPFYSVENVIADDFSQTKHITQQEHAELARRCRPERGDILLTRIGEIGATKLIDWDVQASIYVSLALLKVDKDEIDNRYLYWYTKTSQFLSGIERDSLINAIPPKINMGEIGRVKIAFPRSRKEQEAIADVMADADAIIASLEKLIAKKRNIKQGAMQVLFLRRDGKQTRLAQVSTLKGRIGWQGLKQTEFTSNSDEPFLITGENFKNGSIRWDEVYHVSEERYQMAKDIQLREGDVLLTKDGTIGKTLYVSKIPYPGKATLNSHLLVFRPVKGSYHPKYLYYQLNSRRFSSFIEQSKSGSTFFGISQAAVGDYPMLLPPIDEQVQVACVLSDMDAEIESLEAKLAKARLIKQGMMQELLTGKRRLV